MDDPRSSRLLDEAARYRELASTARAIADRFDTPEVRARLQQIFDRYERFAQEAVQAMRN